MVFKAKLKTTFLMTYLIFSSLFKNCDNEEVSGAQEHMTQLLLLGKFEYGGGPIFKVVLEC